VGLVATPVLTERLARPDRALADRAEIRRLALAFADADAQCGDDRSARRWRETVEALDGVLEPAADG
jgi:NAD(P)H-dependent FMN reductase